MLLKKTKTKENKDGRIWMAGSVPRPKSRSMLQLEQKHKHLSCKTSWGKPDSGRHGTVTREWAIPIKNPFQWLHWGPLLLSGGGKGGSLTCMEGCQGLCTWGGIPEPLAGSAGPDDRAAAGETREEDGERGTCHSCSKAQRHPCTKVILNRQVSLPSVTSQTANFLFRTAGISAQLLYGWANKTLTLIFLLVGTWNVMSWTWQKIGALIVAVHGRSKCYLVVELAKAALHVKGSGVGEFRKHLQVGNQLPGRHPNKTTYNDTVILD